MHNLRQELAEQIGRSYQGGKMGITEWDFNEEVDAILDTIIQALPELDTESEFEWASYDDGVQDGRNDTIQEIKQLLINSKKGQIE